MSRAQRYTVRQAVAARERGRAKVRSATTAVTMASVVTAGAVALVLPGSTHKTAATSPSGTSRSSSASSPASGSSGSGAGSSGASSSQNSSGFSSGSAPSASSGGSVATSGGS